jgi:hypothetical protein
MIVLLVLVLVYCNNIFCYDYDNEEDVVSMAESSGGGRGGRRSQMMAESPPSSMTIDRSLSLSLSFIAI